MTPSETAPEFPPVIVLAGGFGTRIRHLLPDVPKPMAPVAGRPFVEWVVRYFARFGATQFVLSTGHLADVVARHFDAQPVPHVHVSCVPETTPLGTAGGALNCLPRREEADRLWLVVNGDSLVFADPTPLLPALRTGDADATLLGLALDDASRFGTLDLDAANRLRAFREKQPGAGVINAGVYGFREAALRAAPITRPLSFEFDVFPVIAARGRASVVPTQAPFLDIGTPATFAEAEQFITRHQAHFL